MKLQRERVKETQIENAKLLSDVVINCSWSNEGIKENSKIQK